MSETLKSIQYNNTSVVVTDWDWTQEFDQLGES